jgi:hypothetical protein
MKERSHEETTKADTMTQSHDNTEEFLSSPKENDIPYQNEVLLNRKRRKPSFGT